MNVLYLDCCIRGEVSRTRRLGEALLSGVKHTRVDLNEAALFPLDGKTLALRQKALDEGRFSDPIFHFAREFSQADVIVAAAPFWDMGIPTKLKTYFEHVSVEGFTFKANADGSCTGNCRAEHFVYLTTRGLDIPDGSEMEQASPYLKALCTFFGIPQFSAVSAYGLDMVGEKEGERRLACAIEEAKALRAELFC